MYRPKDERLVELAEHFNVAQFVSFSAGSEPRFRYGRLHGSSTDERFTDLRAAIEALMKVSAGTLNVRSFRPGQDKGNPFKYGLTSIDQVISAVRSLAADGYSTIVNETIDTADGGVSGVILGGIMEFVPLDTPRGVEKPGAVSIDYKLGLDMLSTVYGFWPEVMEANDARIEFSVHPLRVGYRHSHTLLWEIERGTQVELQPTLLWPNRFSRFIGDKAFGLLVAHIFGLPVPETTVVARTVAPFKFGQPTGTSEFWIRTCPVEPQPGRFTTEFGWHDPFAIMAREDPDASAIASVLSQEGVDAAYSGASLPAPEEESDHIEGVAGSGEAFMQGKQRPERLPDQVVKDIRKLAAQARRTLGPVRLEFAHDGQRAWVVQLHLSAHRYRPGVINPGTPENGWLQFDPSDGLETLNELIVRAKAEGRGVNVVAPVGITSHVGDLLRKAGVPAQLSRGL